MKDLIFLGGVVSMILFVGIDASKLAQTPRAQKPEQRGAILMKLEDVAIDPATGVKYPSRIVFTEHTPPDVEVCIENPMGPTRAVYGTYHCKGIADVAAFLREGK